MSPEHERWPIYQNAIVMTTIARTNYVKLGIVALISLLIASAWLVFPYLVQGKDLMRGVGSKAKRFKGDRRGHRTGPTVG